VDLAPPAQPDVLELDRYYWYSNADFGDVVPAVHCSAPTYFILPQHQRASKVDAMVSLLLRPPLNVNIGQLFADALQHRLQSFDIDLELRPNHALRPGDVQHVESVGIALALVVAQGLPLQRAPLQGSKALGRLERVCNDGVLIMHRWWLWDGKRSSARLHLFPSASETTIHNHTASFASFNVSGEYEHAVWRIDASQGSHEASKRSSDGALAEPEIHDGRLVRDVVYKHVANHAYFLSSDRFHTVAVPPGQLEPTLTLFYKDLTRGSPSHVLRPLDGESGTTEAPPRIGRSTEMPETDPEIINRVYATMESCLRSSAASLHLQGPLATLTLHSASAVHQGLTT
jgi:hypothetical protein